LRLVNLSEEADILSECRLVNGKSTLIIFGCGNLTVTVLPLVVTMMSDVDTPNLNVPVAASLYVLSPYHLSSLYSIVFETLPVKPTISAFVLSALMTACLST
jgi:hypothetical protein